MLNETTTFNTASIGPTLYNDYILLSHSADALLLASAYIFDDEGRYSHFVFVLIVELMHVEQLIKPPKKTLYAVNMKLLENSLRSNV